MCVRVNCMKCGIRNFFAYSYARSFLKLWLIGNAEACVCCSLLEADVYVETNRDELFASGSLCVLALYWHRLTYNIYVEV